MYHCGTDYLNSLAAWSGRSKFSLHSVSQFLRYLGDPQNKVPSIIVTGTNGKGSVSAALSSILGAAGYRVGLNTSPHLYAMNERILLDGEAITAQDLNEIGSVIKEVSERTDLRLTFHEALTVAGILAFDTKKVEFAVMEVGLGGRYDAANTIKRPELSVIVSVQMDHEALLGNTIEKIAYEKSGIMRSSGRVVLGDLTDGARAIIRYVSEKLSAKSISYGIDFTTKDSKTPFFCGLGAEFPLNSSLKGEHQLANMAVASAAALTLGIEARSCERGVSEVFWPGRLETLKYNSKEVLIDCAHNPAGANALVSYLRSQMLSNISVGFGAIDSKNWRGMVDILLPVVNEWNILEPPTPSAVRSDEISMYLKERGVTATSYGRDYRRFFERWINNDSTVYLITGSIYLVGELRRMITPEIQPIWRRR